MKENMKMKPTTVRGSGGEGEVDERNVSDKENHCQALQGIKSRGRGEEEEDDESKRGEESTTVVSRGKRPSSTSVKGRKRRRKRSNRASRRKNRKRRLQKGKEHIFMLGGKRRMW